jgi:hypothetical protein
MTSSETTGTATLIPIAKLRLPTVQKVVREALADGGVDYDAIAEFLASVDWSHTQGKSLKLMPLLGQMEHWDTEYIEGDIDKTEYRLRLATLLADFDAKPVRVRRSPVSART